MVTVDPGVHFAMLDNAEHSLVRGYELLIAAIRKDDARLIKEAVIWVCHGVELCLKQLLVESSEYLVLKNVDTGIKRLARLRTEDGMAKATILDLLDHDHTVHTIGYSDLVSRVAVVLDLPELGATGTLRRQLDDLAALRNRIVHSPADVDLAEAAALLVALAEPLFDVAKDKLADGFTYAFCMSFMGNAHSARFELQNYKPIRTELAERVLAVVVSMRGQRVRADLLAQQGEIGLPDLVGAKVSRELGRGLYLATGERGRLLIAVVEDVANKERMAQLSDRARRYPETRLWVVTSSGTYPYVYPDLWVSTESDLAHLERHLGLERPE